MDRTDVVAHTLLKPIDVWKAEDINFARVNLSEIRSDQNMFLVLVGSSFLEITASLYTSNLIEYNRGLPEIIDWLVNVWMPEELEHGRAMKAYVQKAWPEYNWDDAYRQFSQEFQPYCGFERYQQSRALEMQARCVTETGAATFYKALRDSTKEPVLKALLDQMQRDEIRHYKYFLRYFQLYNSEEKNSRSRLLRGMMKRALRVYDEDMFIACKYAFAGDQDDVPFEPYAYKESVQKLRQMTRRHYPIDQAVKMLAQPFGLSPNIRKIPIFLFHSLSAFI